MNATTSASTAASDVSAGSSTAPSSVAVEGAPSKPQTMQQRMLQSVAKRSADASANAKPPSPQGLREKTDGVLPESSPGEESLDSTSTDVQAKEKPDEQSKRSIPEAAFKARLGQVQGKLTSEKEAHSATRLSNEKLMAALELQQGEIARYRQQLQEGRAYDERDEEIASRDLTSSAQEASARLVREHQEALREAQEQFLQESKREQWKEKLSNQLEDALPRYELASRNTVIAALKANPRLSVDEAAKTVHLRETERLAKLGYAPRAQQSPPTARTDLGVRSPGSSSSSTGRFKNNAQGMRDFLDAQRAARSR